MTDLVKRLRDWQHVYPEDYDKPIGHLYEEAADRIEELESQAEWMEGVIDMERAKVERLRTTLKRLQYWFDADQEVLDAMTPDERADHMRQLKLIREALNNGEE